MSARDPLLEPESPKLGPVFRGLLWSSLAGATATTFAVLAFMFFVAYLQDRWSIEFLGYALFMLQVVGGAWAVLIHTPLWLLVERRGWNKYLCALIEVVLMLPILAAALAVSGILSPVNFISLGALFLLPVLVLAGAADLARKSTKLRRFGWIVWLAVTGIGFLLWLFAGILPGALG